MKKLLIIILACIGFSCGEDNPISNLNDNTVWQLVSSANGVDSLYCINGISGYYQKEYNLNNLLKIGDTVRITFDYKYRGYSQNTLKFALKNSNYNNDLITLNLQQGNWNYYLYQGVINNIYNNNVFYLFYSYLVNSSSIYLRDVKFYVKR